MDERDVIELLRYAPYTKAVAVHMEAINHCLVTREELSGRLARKDCAPISKFRRMANGSNGTLNTPTAGITAETASCQRMVSVAVRQFELI